MRTALKIVATIVLAVVALLALCVWWVARDDVARLRALSARHSAPVAPVMRSAIVASGDYVIERPRWSFGAFRALKSNVVSCGPALIAYPLVRKSRRAWRHHVASAIETYVVTRVFEPEELLRIYAHTIYLGRDGKRDILGIEDASRTYFAKPARELTPAEAATLAAIIRSPNVYRRDPVRLLRRRNHVLHQMKLTPPERERALAEPVAQFVFPRRS
ncbi:MAG TPA: transglycosylase domain-containing protein [Thermoanaerobaculia bacterium]|nr:transglycosylase domain-containing protein [Thermoanaerobaculia bacterium]